MPRRFDLPTWDGTCDRVAYSQAMEQGHSVVEMNDPKAAQEVEPLTENVLQTVCHE